MQRHRTDAERTCARCDADAVPGSRFCGDHGRVVTDGGQQWPVSEAVEHSEYAPLDMANNITDERVQERIEWVDGFGRAYAAALDVARDSQLVTDGGVDRPQRGPLQDESDARAWSGVDEDSYPFEVRAETFVFGTDAATGQSEALRLEAGDEFVDADSDGATSYRFRCAERTTDGTWTLVWDMASSDPHDDGRVASGGPAIWAKRLREGRLVPIAEWTDRSERGVERL